MKASEFAGRAKGDGYVNVKRREDIGGIRRTTIGPFYACHRITRITIGQRPLTTEEGIESLVTYAHHTEEVFR